MEWNGSAGQASPQIISADILAEMKRGSVVVDMAADDEGGNCYGLSYTSDPFTRNHCLPHDLNVIQARLLKCD
jgi:NAD/NADP transhydrogenase alpha subunit